MDIINIPLGWILAGIYWLVGNYGFTLILFTLVMKMILLPLNFKQQKSMVQTTLLQPKLKALEKQYGDNKEKYSEEMMKLYKKHGVNPMAGCLPLLLQFPILIGLYNVIRYPLFYMRHIPNETIAQLSAQYGVTSPPVNAQIELAHKMFLNGEPMGINFNFFGLDLSQTPQFGFNLPNLGISWLWLIPIIAAVTTFLSSKLMNIGIPKETSDPNKPKRPPKPGEKDPNQTANTMTMFMPFMTLWFTFIMPTGISLYWIAGNVIQVAQQYIINRHYVPKIKERMSRENEELESNRKKRKNNRRSR